MILGISQHDCGWQAEDSRPQLNVHGYPEHVFEADILTALDAWGQSVDQVIARDPYAGMLVSLHTMALANRAAVHEVEHQDEVSRQKTFRIRRFVHRQIEIQEQLRGKLQMRTDQPLRGGLAEPGRSPEEDLLRANFFLLELLDQVSLNLCFNEPIFGGLKWSIPGRGWMRSLPGFRRMGREACSFIPGRSIRRRLRWMWQPGAFRRGRIGTRRPSTRRAKPRPSLSSAWCFG